MSANELRQAAALMRKERGAHEFYLAVADWLDATAHRIDMGKPRKGGVLPGRNNHSWRGSRQALAVARAYLQGDQ